jgi:ABC-type dipeptide/oligopeptide/nickel transport system ATPase subunit
MSKVIEVKHLVKEYGKKEAAFLALKGLDLTIEKGKALQSLGKAVAENQR